MISAYTTAFNLKNYSICFDEVFSNWLYYFDEIVVATFEEEYEETKQELSKSKYSDQVIVTARKCDISDVFWEGKLKNHALRNCSYDIAFQVDLDERVSGDKKLLKRMEEGLRQQTFPCSVMLPTLDLFEDLHHYITIGGKWYMHHKEGCYRGAVNFARKEDGTLDHSKSDTCELIDSRGSLIPCVGKVDFSSNNWPKIIHLGYLNLDERNKVNEFWGKIWNHRKTGELLDTWERKKIKTDSRKKPHNLPLPLWPTIR